MFVPLACGSEIAAPTPPPLDEMSAMPAYKSDVRYWCDVSGSVRFDGKRRSVVPGASGLPDLSWITIPAGFCVHYFASAPNASIIRFAPGRELFATSPTQGSEYSGPGGKSAILVLPDDNRDGLADSADTFVDGVQAYGLAFANGSLYFQDGDKIMKVRYAAGDRRLSRAPTVAADFSKRPSDFWQWPRPLDVANDGTVYVIHNFDLHECDATHPFASGVLAIDGTNPLVGTPIAKGLAVGNGLRCQRDFDHCFASEFLHGYEFEVGRDKIMPVQAGDDWGSPCCATKDVPFPSVQPKPDCSGVATESASFFTMNGPAGLDFERGLWPTPWGHRMFVALLGQWTTGIAAQIISIEIDQKTGMPISGGTKWNRLDWRDPPPELWGSALAFATGWDPGDRKQNRVHGIPSDVTFAEDGRMFVAQNQGPDALDGLGIVIWFAPLDLPRKKR